MPSTDVPYTPILATLGYVLSVDRRSVLMVHRNSRPDDQQLGKYNGLGGKLEPGEDIVAGIRREIFEEAGLQVSELLLRGTLNWPGFGSHGEDWFGFVFLITEYSGEPPTHNEEGDLHWVALEALGDLELYEGDRLFLPHVFDESVRQFHGVMSYLDNELQDASVTVIR